MKIAKRENFDVREYDALIIPFSGDAFHVVLPEAQDSAIRCVLGSGRFKTAPGSLFDLTTCVDGKVLHIIMLRMGNFAESSNREIFLHFADAFRKCRKLELSRVAVLLDNVPELLKNTLETNIAARHGLLEKLCELPWLAAYTFRAYKTSEAPPEMDSVDYITGAALDDVVEEASICGESVRLARDLVNHPSVTMTPERFAREAERVCNQCGVEIAVFDRAGIEARDMRAFLSVARATGDEPRLIVMRYRGGSPQDGTLGLVGKGIIFDSGGYTIKSSMATMHDDMGGAAAVLGAMRAIALRGLRVNIAGILPVCRNMISPDAYVPGDVIGSKSGRTIEVLSTDAEGRLILADGITCAIREESADTIVDIATLTGAAKQAVGNRSAVVTSTSEKLYDEARLASLASCEKIWRLDLDGELRHVIDSHVADIANSRPGNTAGAGAIIAALFLREFTEGRPWLHIDMASVNWAAEDGAYFQKGATGYGVSLLYRLAEIRSRAN
ncbi:MAG: leucyl aminopeptidase family protein [Synergistaceae bacterium]|jgi:leucyl aminopeptidase|nr:leucyl aminopeptidase family protein [Synergistaceae bacterium]